MELDGRQNLIPVTISSDAYIRPSTKVNRVVLHEKQNSKDFVQDLACNTCICSFPCSAACPAFSSIKLIYLSVEIALCLSFLDHRNSKLSFVF